MHLVVADLGALPGRRHGAVPKDVDALHRHAGVHQSVDTRIIPSTTRPVDTRTPATAAELRHQGR